ncbi:hypothetical protein J6590_008784 [Homalodisca vitripennis]|nr:hypothetical protein J6590_008784 [Homalodisca vitripennis]
MSISSAEEEDNIGDLYENEITFQEESDLDLQLGDSIYTAEDQADIQALETIGANFESPAAEEQGDKLWRFYPGGIKTSENFLRTVIKIKDSSTLSHIDIAESRKSGQVYNLLDKIKKSINSREVPSYSIQQAKQSIREVKKELERTIKNMETADFFGKTQDTEREDQQGARSILEEESTPQVLSDEKERSRSDLESSDEEEERGKEIKEDDNTDVTPFLSSLSTEPVDPLFIDSLRDMNYQINQEVISSITEDPALSFLPVPDLKKFQTSNKEPLCRSVPSAPTFKRREDSVDESSIDSTENNSVPNSSTGAIPKTKNNHSKKKEKRDKNQNLKNSDQLLILDSWEAHRNDQTWNDPVLELTFEQICDKVDTKVLLFKILSHQYRE